MKKLISILLVFAFMLTFMPVSFAASEWWSGTTSTAWEPNTNWGAALVAPGSTASTTNTDTATFWSAGNGNVAIVNDINRNIGSITFDTGAVAAYTIGTTIGKALLLTSGGIIQTTALVANIETINAPLFLEGADGTYTFSSNSSTAADTLNFGGTIAGGAAGATVLTLAGTNTGDNTISGIIGNGLATSVAVTKGGAGTWVLSGANTYSGATNINGGVLKISAANNLGDSSVTNVIGFNTGTLESTSGTYFLGTNRAITLNGAGTIQSDAGTLTVDGTVTNGANLLTVTGAGNTTISGIIGAGAGGLTKTGAGTLTLSGANTYTGLTDVQAGTLSLSGGTAIANTAAVQVSGGTLDVVTSETVDAITLSNGAISGAGTLIGSSYSLTDSGTISASLAGAGTLTKTGAGTATLSGVNTYTGLTTVSAGTLALNNTSAIVGPLTLNGTGAVTLGTNTITLAGASAVTTGATTAINTTFNGSTSFGNIKTTTGLASVDAGTGVNVAVGGYIPNNTQFKIIDGSAGGAVGTLTPTKITDNSFAVNFSQVANTDDLILTATRTIMGVTTTENSTAVANAINSVGAASGDFLSVLNVIDTLPSAAAVDAAYSQMDPIANGGAHTASFDQIKESLGIVTGYLEETRNGANGKTGVSTGDEWKNAGMWIKGFGTRADQGTRSGIAGYKSNMWGAEGGADGLVNDNTRVGLAGSYASTAVDNEGEPDGTDISSYQGTVYSSYDDPSPWYVDGAFSFTWNGYDSSRAISFGSINRTADSSYDGQQYTGLLNVGYVLENTDIEKGQGWVITPMASFTYSHLNIDSYTETNAGDLNLQVNNQGYDLAQSSLGLKISHPFKSSDKDIYVPEIHGKWLYDFIGDKFATAATFTGGGSSFATEGATPAQSSFNVGAGLTGYNNSKMSLSFVYDFQVKSGYTSHTGQAVFRYNF